MVGVGPALLDGVVAGSVTEAAVEGALAVLDRYGLVDAVLVDGVPGSRYTRWFAKPAARCDRARPDVVVTDLLCHDSTESELQPTCAATAWALPVVVLAAAAHSQHADGAGAAGAHTILRKSADLAVVVTAVREAYADS